MAYQKGVTRIFYPAMQKFQVTSANKKVDA